MARIGGPRPPGAGGDGGDDDGESSPASDLRRRLAAVIEEMDDLRSRSGLVAPSAMAAKLGRAVAALRRILRDLP